MEQENIYLLILSVYLIIGIIIFVAETKKREENIKEYEKKDILKKREEEENIMVEALEYDEVIEESKYYDTIKEAKLPSITKIETTYKTNKDINVILGDYMITSISNTIDVLESIGIKVTPVRTGVEIINRIKKGEKYDVIITNNIYKNGNCDGPKLVKILKNMEDFKIPIVVLTISKDMRKKFINEYGFDEYIEKYITQEKAINTLEKLIKDLKFEVVEKKGKNK